MGDGGFWHNGCSPASSRAVQTAATPYAHPENGYTSATGTQEIISSPPATPKAPRRGRPTPARAASPQPQIEPRSRHRSQVAGSLRQLRRRGDAPRAGRGVHHRRAGAQVSSRGRVPARAQGACGPGAPRAQSRPRMVRVKYGVDEDTCSGTIRASGCPGAHAHPQGESRSAEGRSDPTVIDGCVGCACAARTRTRGAVPVVLSRRGGDQRAAARAARRRAARRRRADAPAAMTDQARPLAILVAALGGRAAGCSPSGWSRWRATPGIRAEHVDPRCRPAHRRDHLLRGDLSGRDGGARGRSPVAEPAAVRRDRPAGRLRGARAARMVYNGMASAGRTFVVGLDLPRADHREKIRSARPLRRRSPARSRARARAPRRRIRHGRLGRNAGTAVSAVMLGAIAASGVLPIRREAFERVIRDSGLGVAASLAGFAAGFDAVRAAATVGPRPRPRRSRPPPGSRRRLRRACPPPCTPSGRGLSPSRGVPGPRLRRALRRAAGRAPRDGRVANAPADCATRSCARQRAFSRCGWRSTTWCACRPQVARVTLRAGAREVAPPKATWCGCATSQAGGP